MRAKRSNYMGTLMKKPSGIWQARWMYRGKLHTKTTGETEKRKALVVLERLTRPYREKDQLSVIENLERELERLKKECAAAQRNMPIPSVYDSWRKTLRKGNISQETLDLYSKYFSSLVTWCEDNGVEDAHEMDSEKVKSFLDWLGEKVGAASFNQRLSWYRRVWKALSLEENLWDVEKMKVKSGTREAFEVDDIRKILDACGDDTDMKVLIFLGMYTGMRISDCGMLRWQDVDFEKKLIGVTTIKTGTYVQIPLHPALEKVLRKVYVKGKTYVSEKNMELQKRDRLSEAFGNLLRVLGYETHRDLGGGKRKLLLGFHSFRHAFISWALNSGMSEILVQNIVGHSAFQMTMKYYHKDLEKTREGIMLLPGLA